jgi:hypothetical protein
MPIFKLKIEVDDADRERLQQLAAYAQDQDKEKRKAEILNERCRTIEQVKRLYAVVMGFAVWSCITNTYQSARRLADLPSLQWDSYLILFAEFVAFNSLIALFYLGAERMLDRKYLRADSAVPKWGDLWFDLCTLGFSALLFAVLANSYPYTSPTVMPEQIRDTLYNYFLDFIILLIVLYLSDAILLFFQRRLVANDDAHRELRRAYSIWMGINVVSLVAVLLVCGLIYKWSSTIERQASITAIFLLLWHVGRFFADFISTFRFYYPPDDLPA